MAQPKQTRLVKSILNVSNFTTSEASDIRTVAATKQGEDLLRSQDDEDRLRST